MGALTSAIGSVTQGIGAINALIGTTNNLVGQTRGFGDARASVDLRKQQELALRQLQQQQAGQMRDINEQAALDSARITADASAAETSRLAALRRAVARQRAQFGGSGLSSEDAGSAQAVLLGLFEESDTERAERARLDDLRGRVLGQNIESQKRLNILQASQLKERQRFERETMA